MLQSTIWQITHLLHLQSFSLPASAHPDAIALCLQADDEAASPQTEEPQVFANVNAAASQYDTAEESAEPTNQTVIRNASAGPSHAANQASTGPKQPVSSCQQVGGGTMVVISPRTLVKPPAPRHSTPHIIMAKPSPSVASQGNESAGLGAIQALAAAGESGHMLLATLDDTYPPPDSSCRAEMLVAKLYKTIDESSQPISEFVPHWSLIRQHI